VLAGPASPAGVRCVGILPTAAYRGWLEAILRHYGLRPDEVSIVPLAPPLEVDALAGGGVAAHFTSDPMATAALARGIASVVPTLGPTSTSPSPPRQAAAGPSSSCAISWCATTPEKPKLILAWTRAAWTGPAQPVASPPK